MIPWTFHKRIFVRTKLSAEEIAKLLSNEIAKPTTSFFERTPIIGNKFYMGSVSNQGFEIRRIIYTRNTFLPIIYGQFIPTATGTQVGIIITLHPLMIAISLLICAFLLFAPFIMGMLFLLGGFVTDFPGNPILIFIPLAIAPFALLVFYYSFVLLGFSFEANEAEKYITSFFNRISSST